MADTAAALLPATEVEVAPISDPERTLAIQNAQTWIDAFGRDGELNYRRSSHSELATILLRADAHIRQPGHAERWAAIPAAELDPRCLAALRPLGVAARVAAASVESQNALATEAKLAPPLVESARARRARSMRYLDYHLSDLPAAKAELDSIRRGRGYNDLERDLRRIAALTRHYAEHFAADRHYTPQDADECDTLADRIAVGLAQRPATSRTWLDGLWLAARTCYHVHVRPTAMWMYRLTPSHLAYYPSLFPRPTAGRRGAA